MEQNNLLAVIEGILFVYGDDGVALSDLQDLFPEVRPSAIKDAIASLEARYAADDSSAFAIQRFATNKYRLHTKPALYEWFAKLEHAKEQSKLSHSTVQVLSIIAYKGPISKSQIDEIRNADSSYQVHKLKERKLIRSVGKSDELGHANLYAITENFFKLFNLDGGRNSMPQLNAEQIEQEINEALEGKQSSSEGVNRDLFATDFSDFGDN